MSLGSGMKISLLLSVCLPLLTAQAVEVPHWINVAPLLPGHESELAADQRMLYERTVVDGTAFSMKLVPEGNPATDKAAAYVPRFVRMRELLSGSKGRCGILLQATMGHGWVPDSETPFQRIVSPSGQSPYVFCPLDAGFLAYIRGQVARLAAEKPAFFMVDDDTRLISGRGGCFCPLHLAETGKRLGRTFSRETLITELDKDEAVRRVYDQVLTDSVAGLMQAIREEFDKVDASIPGSLCRCSQDARTAGRLARILAAKGQRPLVRINNSRYVRETMRDISDWLYHTARQLAVIPHDVDVLCEPDTWPQNRYSVSAADMNAHISLSLLEGCRGGKLWITRMSNWEPDSGLTYRRVLAENANFHRELLKLAPRWEGVREPLPSADVISLEEWKNYATWGGKLLGRFGIPFAFSSEMREGGIVALSSDVAADLTRDDLARLFRGKVLLEGLAAVALTARGCADLLGCSAREWQGPVASFERLEDGRELNAKIDAVRLLPGEKSVRKSVLRHRASALDETSVDVGAGVLLNENAVGGRSLVFAGRLPDGMDPANPKVFHFYNETRKRQIVDLLMELAGGVLPFPYYPGDAEVLLRWGVAANGSRVLVLFNSGHDRLDEVPVVFPEGTELPVARRLMPDGGWRPVSIRRDEKNAFVFETELDFAVPVVLTF